MSAERYDYVLKLIEQLGVVLRCLRQQLQLTQAKAPDVVREAQAAQTMLLGPLAATVQLGDASTAVRLLRNRELVSTIGNIRAASLVDVRPVGLNRFAVGDRPTS